MAFGFLEYPRMVTLERLLLDHDLWVFRLYAYLHDVRNGSTSAQSLEKSDSFHYCSNSVIVEEPSENYVFL